MNTGKDAILKALRIDEEALIFRKLYRYKWFKDMYPSDQKEMINNISQCAKQAHENLVDRYGSVSTEEYAERLGVNVCESEEVPSEFFLHFALFQTPPPLITLTMPSIRMASDYIKKYSLEGEFKNIDIRGFALSHELYHALENIHPEYYTVSKKIEKKIFKIRIGSESPKVLSEMGARFFSRLLQNTDVTVGALETLLVFAFQEFDQIRKEEISKNNWGRVVKFYTQLRSNK
jgi:hypothetical protein